MPHIGIVQASLQSSKKENLQKILSLMEEGKKQGAEIFCLPELFLTPYFCKNQQEDYFSLASEIDKDEHLTTFKAACKKLSVVALYSFFEKDGPHFYNSSLLISHEGESLGLYRKTHIPDGPGYQEKFYFKPGNSGFKVFATKFGNVGMGICWDQWFPETARILALKGAQIILYPTAIGSEPEAKDLHTKDAWQRVMIGHAVANMIYVAAANRIGDEDGQIFYGHSFIANNFGDTIGELTENKDSVLVKYADLAEADKYRNAFGFFRDRRVSCYGTLLE